MTIKYTNTLDDLLKFNLYNFKNSKHVKRNILNGRIFALVYLIITVLYAVNKLDMPFSMIIIIFVGVIAILWFVLFPLMYTNSVNTETKEKYKKHRYSENITVSFELDNTIRISKQSETKQYDKSSVSNIIFLPKYIYIYFTDYNYVIVPLFGEINYESTELVNYLQQNFTK